METLNRSTGIHNQIYLKRNQHYSISIPESAGLESPKPLILVLHWGGFVTPFYGRSILAGLALPALNNLEAFFAAPDCIYGDWENTQSETAVRDLVSFLSDNYNIDKNKIAIIGYSLGGLGTWYIAGRSQDLFSFAIPMACTPPKNTLEIEWEIPIYAIHSRMDELFPFHKTEHIIQRLRRKGVKIEFVPLESSTHYDTSGFIIPLMDSTLWIKQVWG